MPFTTTILEPLLAPKMILKKWPPPSYFSKVVRPPIRVIVNVTSYMTLYDKSDFTPLLVLYLYCLRFWHFLSFFYLRVSKDQISTPINLNLMGMSYVTKNSFGLPEKKKKKNI